VEIRPQALRSDTDVASAPLSAAHVLVSHAFTPTGFIPPVLAPFSSRLCALTVVLPWEDLEHLGGLLLRLEDGTPSDGFRYFSIASTTAVGPLPPGLTHRLTHLTTMVLRNIVPTWKPLESLSSLTTIHLVGDLQPPTYEYNISDFFELLLRTPRLRHLLLSGIGPLIYDVMPEWIVPLDSLETLRLHHCRLQAEILRHLAISLDTKEVSIHAHVRSAPRDLGTVFSVIPRWWRFVPWHVDFYQEGRDRCHLLFVGTRSRKGSRDHPAEPPVLTLELSVTNTDPGFLTTFSGWCIESFKPLSTTGVQELVIHSYQWPRGQMDNPVYDLLQSLSALRRLVLKGCNESPFYEAFCRDRGKKSLVCPCLTVVEINPIVEFRRCLGGQAPCPQLAARLSTLVEARKGRGAPLKRLDVVFPAQCQEEAWYVERRVMMDLGMWEVRVRVA
jgi:hypothetical protein